MSLFGPGHVRPQWLGGGLLHVRDLSCIPEPHVAEHPPHDVHVAQPPSSVRGEGKERGIETGTERERCRDRYRKREV